MLSLDVARRLPSARHPGPEPAASLDARWTGAAGALLAIAAVLGIYGRFSGLGEFSLAVDEYYFVQSVKAIVAHGVPAFETGGFYARGLLPQYLTAGAVQLFGDDGFAYRLPSALFSLGAVPLAYVYGRRLLGSIGGLTLAALLLVSAWEIEFGRFARMYAGLQFFTLLFLIAIDKAAGGRDRRWTYVPHVVLLATFVTHEFAILLVPFLFVHLIPVDGDWRRAIRSRRYALWLATAAVAWFCVSFRLDLRDSGVVNAFPADYAPAASPFWRLPPSPFFTGLDSETLVLLYLALAAGAAVVFLILRYLQRPARESDFLGTLLILAAALHQFLIAGAILLVMAARRQLFQAGDGSWRLHPLPPAAVAIGVLWVGYALSAQDWIVEARGTEYGAGDVARSLFRTFFGWPNLIDPVVIPWMQHLPLIALCAAAAILYQVFTKAHAGLAVWTRHPAIVLVPIALAFSIRANQYSTIRFSFFIYPLVLALILMSAMEAATVVLRRLRRDPRLGPVAGSMACVAVFGLSSDFNVRQIAGVAEPAVRLRTGEFERYQGIWYERSDYESPAIFVNGQAGFRPGDAALVVGQPPVSFYLRVPHGVYYDRAEARFFNVSRAGGTIDLWSNQRLLSTPKDLRDYTTCASRVWMIRSVSPQDHPFDVEEVWSDRLVRSTEAFRSIDGRLEVRQVQLAVGSGCPAPADRARS